MKKIWKDIKGYEGNYQISNMGDVLSIARTLIYSDGRVRFYPDKELSLNAKSNKYINVVLTNPKKNIYVHRLVAEHFDIGGKGDIVNHKDGNKQNNRADNLEWCNYSHNIKHAYDNKLRGTVPKIESFVLIKGVKTIYESIDELSRHLDITRGCAWYRCTQGLEIDGIKYGIQ